MQEQRPTAYETHLAARRARAISINRFLRTLPPRLFKLVVVASRWARGVARALSIVVALERQRTGLLSLTERSRKDMGISLCDAELGAKRLRRRQARLLWGACLGRCVEVQQPLGCERIA